MINARIGTVRWGKELIPFVPFPSPGLSEQADLRRQDRDFANERKKNVHGQQGSEVDDGFNVGKSENQKTQDR